MNTPKPERRRRNQTVNVGNQARCKAKFARRLELRGSSPKPDDAAWLQEEQARYTQSILAPSTVIAYECDWRLFAAWCSENKAEPLPAKPETIARYATKAIAEGRRITTVDRHLSSIAWMHRTAGHASPIDGDARAVLRGARRLFKERAVGREPLLLEDLRRICEVPAVLPIEVRNRSLLLLGWFSAMRRSELAALDLADISFLPGGTIAHLRSSKTDQEGVGCDLAICATQDPKLCATIALQKWLRVRGDPDGPLFLPFGYGTGAGFRSRQAHGYFSAALRPTFTRLRPSVVCDVVKAEVASIGLDPFAYGAHSLRAGFCTSAAELGLNELQISRQTRHKMMATLRKYIRPRDPFAGNPSGLLGC